MWQKSLIALALAGSVTLVGCGGGSSGGSSNNDGGGTPGPTARNDVVGPLDAVQGPVSDQVLSPLAVATAGTPVSGVVSCVDQIVVGDTLDIVDLLAAQADGGVNNFQGSAALVQAELTNLVADLQGLLFSLAGGAGCGTVIPAPGGFGTNPLAGTPLEGFADTLLSTLASVQGQLPGTGAGAGTPDLSVLEGLVGQLADGYASALMMLPAEATSAPVVGPSLTLVGTALDDLESTVGAASSGDPAAVAAQITTTVEHLVNGLLTDVLPVDLLEQGAGVGGDNPLSGPIAAAVDQLTSLLSGGFDSGVPDLGGDALTDVIDSLLAPLTGAIPGTGGGDPTVVLTDLLGQLTGVLGGGTGDLPIPQVGPAALNDALAQITGLLSGAGAMDSPLAPLVDTLMGLLEGLLGDLGN